MKKTYFSPKMEVVKIETTQMLAASARSLDASSEEGFSIIPDGIDGDDDLR